MSVAAESRQTLSASAAHTGAPHAGSLIERVSGLTAKQPSGPTWHWLVGILVVVCMALMGVIWGTLSAQMADQSQQILEMRTWRSEINTHLEYNKAAMSELKADMTVMKSDVRSMASGIDQLRAVLEEIKRR